MGQQRLVTRVEANVAVATRIEAVTMLERDGGVAAGARAVHRGSILQVVRNQVVKQEEGGIRILLWIHGLWIHEPRVHRKRTDDCGRWIETR